MARWKITIYESDSEVDEEFDDEWEFVERVIQLTAKEKKFKLYDSLTGSIFISE